MRRYMIYRKAEIVFCITLSACAICCEKATKPTKVPEYYNPPRTQVRYFPKKVFESDIKGMEDFVEMWYSNHLQALGESSFLEGYSRNAYRFLWLRTFHSPISIRIDLNDDGSGTLTAKRTNGRGGYEYGSLVENRRVEISKVQVDKFISSIDEIDFWNMPKEKKCRGCLDGAQWIIEGSVDGKYHVVDRWSPDGSRFREAALVFLELSGMKVKEIY